MLDFQKIAQSFSKAAHTYQHHAQMQNAMGHELLAFLKQHASSTPLFSSNKLAAVLEMGCGPGNFTCEMLKHFKINTLYLNDLSSSMLQQALCSVKQEFGPLQSYVFAPQSLDPSPQVPIRNQVVNLAAAGNNLGLTLLDSKLSLESHLHVSDNLPAAKVCPLRSALGSKSSAHLSKAASLAQGADLSYRQPTQAPISQWTGKEPSLGLGAQIETEHQLERWSNSINGSLPKAMIQPLQVSLLAGDILAYLPKLPSVDLVISNAVMQWLPLEQVLKACRKISPWLVFSSFTTGTFCEFASLGVPGLKYLSVEQIQAVLSAHTCEFKLSLHTQRQYFGSIKELMVHLSSTGINAVKSEPLRPGALRRLLREYAERYSDHHGVYLTWCPYYVIARLS